MAISAGYVPAGTESNPEKLARSIRNLFENGMDSTAVSAAITAAVAAYLAKASNLSDVASAATAFGNIKQDATKTATGVTRLWTVTVFTTSTAAWDVAASLGFTPKELIIEAWGGGASGAAGNTTTSTRGSGGAGGAYLFKHYTGTMDSTLAITIGAGGTAVTATAGGANGTDGGNTTVVGANLGTLTAGGGTKGANGAASGGAGGTATNGDENIKGQDGQVGQNGGATTAVASGGSSPRGGMGGQSNIGADGSEPGGGGSCGNHTAASVSGAGAKGRVKILAR